MSRLVRRSAGEGEISWDPASGRLNVADLAGVRGVVHLAGENIAARWSRPRKTRIRASRIQGTRLLSETLARLDQPPEVLVSASAVGIYGSRADEILTENSRVGDPSTDFLASVALEWEAAADPARRAGIRVVHSRFGVVLSPAGGALQRLLPAFRLGLGGRLGSGSQWMSWISIDDAVGAVRHMLLTGTMTGPANTTAPEPVTNRDFTRIVSRVLRRPAWLPVPATVLRLVFGEMAEATVLASARVLPSRLLQSGFRFEYPHLDDALRHMLA